MAMALALSMMVAPAYAATAYSYHPEVKAYGTVQKDVYPSRSMFDYVDDDGLTSSLPFDRQNSNISITIADIIFEDDAIANHTVSKATESISSNITSTFDYFVVDEEPYVYLKITNSSMLQTDTAYSCVESLLYDSGDEKTASNDDYIFVTGHTDITGTNLVGDTLNNLGYVKFVFTDSGGTERSIKVGIRTEAPEGFTYSTLAGSECRVFLGGYSTFGTVQLQLQEILDACSVNWELVKFEGVKYGAQIKTDAATLDATSTVEMKIRHAFISSTPIVLKDSGYPDNEITVNGTSINFTKDGGENLEVSGKAVSKIKDVSINFVYEDKDWKDGSAVEDGKATYSEALAGFNYEWLFNLPTTTEAEADTLTYSSTNITLKSWFDGSYFGLFTSRGSDKLDDIDTKKVTTTSGVLMENRAWSYGVESSLTEDTDYEIKIRVGNLPDNVIEALTAEPQYGLGSG